MLLKMQEEIAKKYKSKSQKIRVMSENWLKNNGYCVNCGSKLEQHENNKPVADFYCNNCNEDFELKSKNGISEKILDGAYSTMIEKIQKNDIPNFFFLNYNHSFEISNLIIIPNHYFTENIIEKRKPLAIGAKREGWVGCNINLKTIPQSGRIHLIKNYKVECKNNVIEKFSKTLFLKKNKTSESKGWIFDTMNIIDRLDKTEFELSELYAFEQYFKLKHPKNNNIKDRIRRELQLLRDNNYLEFLGKGKYRLK